jgi:Transglycosylase-like domain
LRVPTPTGRPAAAVAAALITIVVVNLSTPDAVAAKQPRGLKRFMAAVGSVESGGDYTARNPVSGAYGKYQIMPSNWPAWARRYLGDAKARTTPRNQERVAAGKMTALHRWLGTWKRVAYWWLTGSDKTSGWSDHASRYVANVMARYRRVAVLARAAPMRILNERAPEIVYRGVWRTAHHDGYGGDAVRYAQTRGASATVRFAARTVAWHGPLGPTRGQAKVYLDGRYVRTVDLRQSSFVARATLFRASWSTIGKHTLTVVVVGSKGHAMVAIDDFTILR